MGEPVFDLAAPELPPEGRRELDAYYTPEALTRALAKRLEADGFWRGGRVLEPSAGQGAFMGAFIVTDRQPEDVVGVEMHPERAEALRKAKWDVRTADFLDYAADTDDRFELVIGNPPFSGAEAHVRAALALRKRFGVVAFLLRLGFLESAERAAFWKEHPASQVYVLTQRPSFTGGRTDNSAYGLFVWASWWRGPTEMEVISWR